MTDQEWIDLGRRAVACSGWRWMPGMWTTCGGRVLTDPEPDDERDDGVMVSRTPRKSGDHVYGEWVGYLTPDLRDPATLGCLLALVRRGMGTHVVTEYEHGPHGVRWRVADSVLTPFSHPTEAHALVAALESAPETTR